MIKKRSVRARIAFLVMVIFPVLSLISPGCDIVEDLVEPENPSISINDGDTYTYEQTIQLTLSCDDDIGIFEMMISNNPDFSGAYWEIYDFSMTWELSDGFGTKTVYVKFRDEGENIAEVVSASIEYIETITLKVIPSESEIIVGENSNIDIYIFGAIQIISARVTMTFDPSIVEVSEIILEGNGFLLSDAEAEIISSEENMIDNINGKILFGVLGKKSGFTGASGEGIIARITFKGLSAGVSPIMFIHESYKALIMYRYADNENGFESIHVNVSHGSITIQEK